MKFTTTLVILSVAVVAAHAQLGIQQKTYTRKDTIRGSITPERAWWDLLHYNLQVRFNYADSTISGHNVIRYKVQSESKRMQIDLMQPLEIDSVVQNGSKLAAQRDGNAYFVEFITAQVVNSTRELTVFYHGKPQVAARPPWDGGVVWAKDQSGRPWLTVACQGLGASVWFPCKDHQADEADSVRVRFTFPDSVTNKSEKWLTAVAAGHLVHSDMVTPKQGLPEVSYDWVIKSPINNYNIIPYIGHYVGYDENFKGEKGKLVTGYWMLDYNFEKGKPHLVDAVRKTLKNLEYWFGPYPFYEDGYKIVEAPHLGMEHQSAIAYGNGYQYGYLGRDLSNTGWGTKWDFIVVHETAHEWFGNNITTKDLADMWVHESFANYSETLYTTSEFGKEAGNDYVVGSRQNILNDVPIIGKYNVNEEGSRDMYYKGGNMIHMIRQIINDDEKFRLLLRGLNKDFYHMTVTGADVETYISQKSGINFSKLFDQYLRTTKIPVFTYSVEKQGENYYLNFTWTNCVDGFDMPVKISVDKDEWIWVKPTRKPQLLKLKDGSLPVKVVDRNFYVEEKRGH